MHARTSEARKPLRPKPFVVIVQILGAPSKASIPPPVRNVPPAASNVAPAAASNVAPASRRLSRRRLAATGGRDLRPILLPTPPRSLRPSSATSAVKVPSRDRRSSDASPSDHHYRAIPPTPWGHFHQSSPGPTLSTCGVGIFWSCHNPRDSRPKLPSPDHLPANG
jgi:hypothetical protein